MWTGSASDLLRLCAESCSRGRSPSGPPWAKNPRALAGRLRRAQTFLRMLDIEITFSREGRAGNRIIRVSTVAETTVSTVSIVGAVRGNGAPGDQAISAAVTDEIARADDTDGADANAAGFHFGNSAMGEGVQRPVSKSGNQEHRVRVRNPDTVGNSSSA